MTKQTALGDSFFVGSADISGDVGSLSALDVSRAIIDVSALPQGGYDRLLGRADGQIDFNAYFNPSTGRSHPTLDQIGTAAGTVSTIVSLANPGFGQPMASLQAAQVTYKIAIGQDQSIAVTASAMASKGEPVEWGIGLTTGRQVFAAAGTSVAYDNSASFAFGAAAYVHVFAVASGTATIAVQHSATGTSAWSDITGLAFPASSTVAFYRQATTKTLSISRYQRVNVTGTFTGLDFAVNAVVYPSSQT